MTVVSGALVAGMTAAAGNIINDIFDLETDRVNRPARVLPAGILPVRTAWVFYTVLVLTSQTIAFVFIPFDAALIILLVHILLFFYSLKLKSTVLWGNLTVSFLVGLTFLCGGVFSGGGSEVIYPAVTAFFLTFTRELIKDLEDMTGDQASGVVTYPLKYGISKARVLASAGIFLSVFSIPVPVITGAFGTFYLIVSLAFVGIPGVLLAVFLLTFSRKRQFSLASFLLKLMILPALFAVGFDRLSGW
ncbi:MAG: geranylgeranylglycerol-phosphate geranylgeranyltransferase [Bacteroidetes bacterium]|nr:geranylgeranylglycerol-phosphate geranylgeranyltransferase [Bacteroidota bacterium]